MEKVVRIAGAQGFYGDSPVAAMHIVKEQAADYLMHDALAELTLSILQKDKLRDPNLGYARDIEFMAKSLYPLAFKSGIKIVSNSGGLNPNAAATKVKAILEASGVKGVKIATISGDNMFSRLQELQEAGQELKHLDTGQAYAETNLQATHANVYIGAQAVKAALDDGANLILAGRVADPALALGILAHEYGWNIDNAQTQEELDLMASAITVGHVIECSGQASGGNSYAEWPMDYPIHNLGYPIAHVKADGSTVFTKLASQGGKVSPNTIREQLVYEIHDPANYITPDVVVDLTHVNLTEIGENQVELKGVKGKPRPDMLKLTIGQQRGFITEQFFFFSWPYAYDKAKKFVEAVEQIWGKLPIPVKRYKLSIIGQNALHEGLAPKVPDEVLNSLNEIGIRLAVEHDDPRAGKLALSSITCMALNGPPGMNSMPSWGKINRVQLGLWPTLIPRQFVKPTVNLIEL